MANKKTTSILRTVSLVLAIIIFALAMFILFTIVNAKINDEPIYLFGYSFLIVVTDSMTPEIQVGDFVLAKKTSIDNVRLGDNVVFVSAGGALKGYKIIHKCVDIDVVDGEIQLSTQGVKEGAPIDSYPVKKDGLVGVELWHSTFLGKTVSFLSNVVNWVFLAVLLLLVFFGKKMLGNIIAESRKKKIKEVIVEAEGNYQFDSFDKDAAQQSPQSGKTQPISDELRAELLKEILAEQRASSNKERKK